jgi:hypothetical protein
MSDYTNGQKDHIENNCNPIDDDDLHELYDNMLDEVYPECKIAGLSYSTSHALKEIDPTAYRCGFSDWLDAETSDGQLVEIDNNYYRSDDIDASLRDYVEPNGDEDGFLQPTGPLGSRTALSIGGDYIGDFVDDKAAYLAFVGWCEENRTYPNLWTVSDHGNISLYVPETEGAK